MGAGFGAMSFFMIPLNIGLTWLYHLVFITLHNKFVTYPTPPSPTRDIFRWEMVHPLVWGLHLAIAWTGATITLTAVIGFSNSDHGNFLNEEVVLDTVPLPSYGPLWAKVSV